VRIDSSNACGKTLTLKVNYADYQQVTRSRTVSEPILEAREMMRIAMELLGSTEVDVRNVRLLGLSLSNLDGECESESDDCVQLTLKFQD
jgi:DNA polymerase IV